MGSAQAFFFIIYTVMKKEDLFNDEFLKQFKTEEEELNNFLKEIQKRRIEKMLEGAT